MSFKKQKLELTWIGKENRPRLEPRILLEDPAKSYHAAHRVTDNDHFDNRLIFGDNLLALKALEQEFAGKIKCIYIDPPYNTGSAFEHYDDGVEHSIWLSMVRDRMEIIRRLLSETGSIWISLDDNENHYFKVMMDEVFGRQNFVATIIWQKVFTVKNSARHFSDMHDYVVVYAKDSAKWQRNLLPRSEELDSTYSNLDNDPRGPWTTNAVQARNYYSLGEYEIRSPSGKSFFPPKGTYWRISKATFDELNKDGRVWWGRDGTSIPRIKKFLSEAKQGVVPATLWFHNDCGTNAEAKTEVRALFSEESDAEMFITPKPERLLKRILEIASNPGDLVLDSFAGSGTTGAVAHKMGRRWIMVELGEHCHTHIIPRMEKVIDGTDPGGITEAVGWKGGGGFRYFRLAPSLLTQDKWGNWVISKEYNAAMLAEAVCKLAGFTYAPSDTVYWQHGHSTERDFLYVTTQNLNADQLQQLSDEVGADRTLLVMCAAFRGKPEQYPNLTLKKIPRAVLSRCEWGHDDYSLQVQNLPKAPPKPGQMELI
ncbi:MAG: site-specific DNA-methyltransferase [Verrucomicrobiota bacterium]